MERNERSYSTDKGSTVRRYIGGITSVRINNERTKGDAGKTSDSIDGTVVRRQIGGITSIRTSNRGANDSNHNGIRRQIGGITSVRTSNSGAIGSNDSVIQRPIGGFATKRSCNSIEDRDANDGEEEKRRKIPTGTTDSPPTVYHQPSNSRPKKTIYRNAWPRYHPSSFISWNCNGFSTRARYDQDHLYQLVKENFSPEVICIQEARLKADGNERGRPLKDKDYEHVQAALKGPFRHYTPFWSLADKKYAGTLTLVKTNVLENCDFWESDEVCSEGRYHADFVAFTPSSAIDLILRHLGTTRAECGLEDEETKTHADPSPSPKKKQQTSMKSFFAPKKRPGTSASTTRKHREQEHNPEGRFQFFFFPGMDFVQNYAPNNGTKEESFVRRREWDKTMLKFVRERKQILQAVARKKEREKKTTSQCNSRKEIIYSCPDRKLLWCGEYE